MGDTNKTNGAEKSKASEKIPDRKKEAPGSSPELSSIKSKEQQTKVTSAEKTSGISREILGEQILGIDKDTAGKIMSLDETKEIKEQSDAFERLKLVTYTFLGKMLKAEINKETLEKFELLKSIPPDIINKFNATEKVAIKKLQDIASKPGSKLYNEIKNTWKDIVNYASIAFEKTQSTEWIKKTYKEHPLLVIAGAALGAYGIYHVFFQSKKSGEESENQNTFLDKIGLGTTKRKIVAGVIGSLILGGIIGQEHIGEWMEKLTGAPPKTVSKLVNLVKAGKLKEAMFLLLHWNETTQEIVESAEKGLEWLEEKVHLNEMKEAIKKFSTEHNITLPDWMKELSLEQIAKDLGITKENQVSTLAEYAVSGGAALLIYKYAGKKGLAVNAGLYMFIVKQGRDSFGGKLLHGMSGEVDKAKDKILENFPFLSEVIKDTWMDFKSQEAIDHMFDWIGKHPTEAMLAMNGLWICRSMVYKAIKTLLTSGFDFTKFAWKHKTGVAEAAVGAGIVYFGRREFIQDFINTVYDNPGSKEAIEMRDNLDKLADIDRKQPPAIEERQVPAFAKSIIEDPLEALKKLTNIEEYKKGNWAIFINELGVVSLLIKGVSIPIQLSKLTWASITTTYQHIFSPEGNKDGLLMPMLVGGVEGYIFGSAAWEGFKSYKTVLESGGIERGEKLMRSLKSLIPGTKEWRFVLKSCLVGPTLPILKKLESWKLGTIERKMDEIIELAKQKDFPKDKIRKILSDMEEMSIMKDFSAIQDDLSKARLGKYSFDLAERMKQIKKNLGYIDGLALTENRENLIKVSENTKTELRGTQKAGSSLYERVKAIMSGDIKSALSTTEATEEMARIEKEIPKPHEFKINTEELEKLHGAEKANRLTEIARELETREKELQSKLNNEIQKIADEAKLKNIPLSDPSVIEKLEKLDQEITIPFAKNKQDMVEILNREFKKLPAEFRKNPAIASQIAHAIEGTEGSLMTRIVKGGKGRAKMMVLMASLVFCTDQIVHRNGPERELKKIISDLGPELGQLLLDVSPIAGTFSNYYSAVSGREIVTKRDVSGTWDRVTNTIWGTVGLAGDTITVVEALPTGGGSVFANMEIRLAKIAGSEGRLAKAAKKLIVYLPRLERICDKLGGISKFTEKVQEMMKAESAVGKGARAIEKVGMVAGSAMLVGGLAYHMRYAFIDSKTEIDLAPELANASTMPTPEVKPGEVPAAG